MTSHRRRKKDAQSQGLTTRELELAELLEEVLDSVRWMQILGYSNQFLLKEHVDVSDAAQAKVLEAATRAVDKDARLQKWRGRLKQLKGDMVAAVRAEMSADQKGAAEGGDGQQAESETEAGGGGGPV